MGKRLIAYSLRAFAIAATAAALAFAAGCTPQSAFLMGLLPDGTVSALLTHVDSQNEPLKKLVYDLESRKDWNGLAKLSDDNLAINRNHADWWFISGYAHTEANRPGRAADSFGNLVRLAPDEPANWTLLAQSLRDSKQPQKAVQARTRVSTESAIAPKVSPIAATRIDADRMCLSVGQGMKP